MISPSGQINVLEFNCRFGDPEIQAILPLLETPLDQLLLACSEQKLGEFPPIEWKKETCICVVAASQGYPQAYKKGKIITGLTEAEKATNGVVFHAGTKLNAQGDVITDGGRVLGITAIAPTFAEAKNKVYQGVDCINFEGKTYRRDIGHRVL
jgi:phosphoribosylamine--glycine ligase